MITFEKSEGVKTTNHRTILWIQLLVLEYKSMGMPFGKVAIDAEKLTFYKFGLTVGRCRHSTSGLVYSNGHLSYEGWQIPVLKDSAMCRELCKLFNMNNPF